MAKNSVKTRTSKPSRCKLHGPTCGGHRGKLRYERAVLERAEVARLINAGRDEEERAVLMLMYDLALRACEVARLRRADIDLKSGEACVPRGKDGLIARVRLARETLAAIRPFIGREGSIFADWPDWRVKRVVRRAAAAGGLSTAPDHEGGKAFSHILRRSRATHLLADGVEIRQVARRLGHKSWETTMVYAGLSPERNREVDDIAERSLSRVLARTGAEPRISTSEATPRGPNSPSPG